MNKNKILTQTSPYYILVHMTWGKSKLTAFFLIDFHRSPKSPKFSVFERGCTSLEKRGTACCLFIVFCLDKLQTLKCNLFSGTTLSCVQVSYTLNSLNKSLKIVSQIVLSLSDVKELEEHHFVESVQQQVEGALLKYTLASSSQSCNRFTCLQLYLSELRSLSILAEDYLYYKHLSGEVPCNNLLNEMLHAKCCWTWAELF